MSLSLVDVSTGKVYVFPVERDGEVSVKEFFSIVGEKLSELYSEDGGDSICVLSAAVGDNCINICDSRRVLHYYLLDAQPWFIKTAVFSSSHVDVFVKETNEQGNEATIKIDPLKGRIRDIKQKFARMTRVSTSAIHLILEEKELENEKRLLDYNVTNGCVVPCVYGIRQSLLGQPYVNVSHEESSQSPVWRRATPGMWLEGKCTNQICVAYSKMVVMNQGFTNLDFINEKKKSTCPMCYEMVIPNTYGFCMCEWMTVGRKKVVSELNNPHIVRQEWKRIEKGYQYFMPHKSSWLNLKITSRQLNSVELCVICMNYLSSDAISSQCGHNFHTKCKESSVVTCIRCLGDESTTTYQKLFL